MSDCPVCCDIPGYTQHTCERAEFEPESKNETDLIERLREWGNEEHYTHSEANMGALMLLTAERYVYKHKYETAAKERDLFAKMIREAPHDPDCTAYHGRPAGYGTVYEDECDCWKSRL
jgi:hypothetical protein